MSETGAFVRGASVLLRNKTSIAPLDSTDDLGEACIQKDLLAESESLAVLFCKVGYFCGAFLIAEERQQIERMDLRLMVLSRKTAASTPLEDVRCDGPEDVGILVVDPDGQKIPGAEIQGLTTDLNIIGETDQQGKSCLTKAQIGSEADYIVVCREAFFCAAIPRSELVSGETIRVPLARFAVP